jgi:hypothetical protein
MVVLFSAAKWFLGEETSPTGHESSPRNRNTAEKSITQVAMASGERRSAPASGSTRVGLLFVDLVALPYRRER